MLICIDNPKTVLCCSKICDILLNEELKLVCPIRHHILDNHLSITCIYPIPMSTEVFLQWNLVPFPMLYIILRSMFSTGIYKFLYIMY